MQIKWTEKKYKYIALSNLSLYYTLSGTIKVPNIAVNNINKKVICKNCSPFTSCITYSKTSESLRKYYRVEPALDASNNIIDFPNDNNNSTSFKFK